MNSKVREGYKKTELGEIPVEWEVKRLDSIIKKFIVPMRDKPKIFDGTIPWCRIEDIEGNFLNGTKSNQFVSWKTIDEMNLKIHPKGTVICSCSASLGINAITTKDLITNQTFIGLVSDIYIDEKYLYYCMNWNTNRLKKIASGTTIPYISREKFEKFKVLVPPLKEQQRIVSILITVDTQIDQTDKLIEKTKELKKGLMQKLLTKGIGHTEFKKSEVGEIPVEWEVKMLKNISKIKRGASPRPIKDTKWFSEEKTMGWIRISDVTASSKYLTNTTQYLSEEGVKKSRPVKVNDLIMSICATVGKPIIMKMNACIHDGFVLLDEIDIQKYDKEFLYYTLQKYENDFKSMGQTGTQSNLNTNLVGGLIISAPSLKEQKQIANFLSLVDTQIEECENKKSKLQELKKGLMQQLLTGKIRA